MLTIFEVKGYEKKYVIKMERIMKKDIRKQIISGNVRENIRNSYNFWNSECKLIQKYASPDFINPKSKVGASKYCIH